MNLASDFFEEQISKTIHKNVIEKGKRPDGRKLDEVREISTKAGVLPRAHGSGLFYRGLTHILTVATLGALADFLMIEGMEVREKRTFIHQYNFPPFSTGETGRMGAPGRREIGHGALASKALSKIIPEKEVFPYTIRLVSETMSSNGSSSMGSVCASTLALMDAGVPIKAPVSGVAMGIMIEGAKYKVLTDIQGPEDHHGDADFKIAGTKKGITAIQMDVKVDGIETNILGDIMEHGKKGRIHILEEMLKTLSEPKKELSPYAPHIITITINPEKKGTVIGPGGRTINKITDETGARIDLEEDGTVFIAGKDKQSAEKAKEIVENLTYEPRVGETFKGTVVKIMDFGAFVAIKPGIEGLVHISEIAPFRVEKVNDILKEGDTIPVKIKGIDDSGKISLSIKQADPNYASNNGGRKQQGKPRE